MRVLAAATAAHGHLRPVLTVAQHLAGRGHDVTLLTGPDFADLVTGAGVRFAPMPPGAMIDLEDRRERRRLAPGPERLSRAVASAFGDPVPGQHAALQALLTPDTVLVCDAAFVGAWPVLLGAPGVRPRCAVGLGTSPIMDLPAEVLELLRPGLDHVTAMIRRCGVTGPVPSFFTGMHSVFDLTAQLSVREFEPRETKDVPGVAFVGPLPTPTFDTVALPDWWPDLHASRPVVLATQGTAANHDLTELVAPTLDGLADEDVLVVAAPVPDRAALGPVPGNARVAEFLPFADLLPRVSVMVTNGGQGAVQQALRAGIPLVVAGASEDKPLVAARVAASGAGIDLATGTPTAAQVATAVTALRADPRYREAARRMAERIAATDALATITGFVEGGIQPRLS